MKTLNIHSICKCCKCVQQETLHPQAAVVRIEGDGVGDEINSDSVRFDFYSVLFAENSAEECKCCGQRFYDYSAATMIFLRPGEIFRMSASGTLPRKGWILAFHPDLLHHTSLGAHIDSYTFFDYDKRESLHLSHSERDTICCCTANIDAELHHAVDRHSATILARHIQLLLDYCRRFYERQFITRERSNAIIMEQLERLTAEYLSSPAMQRGVLPAADDFAARLGLTPAYFADLLRFLTGKSFEVYFQSKRLDYAASLLLSLNGTPTYVAEALGWGSVTRFSVLFKRWSGMSPLNYRRNHSERGRGK